MEEFVKIPMFPLTLFPLPGELVPLHIFEPKYRQLLEDAERLDISFGIYFNHVLNVNRLGASVRLESVIKRYPGGESDIVVKCSDLFEMDTMFRTYRDKLYPAGDVHFWNVDLAEPVKPGLVDSYVDYLSQIKISHPGRDFTAYHIAAELNLDFEERLRFVALDQQKKESFLFSRLKYNRKILSQAEEARDIFHLN